MSRYETPDENFKWSGYVEWPDPDDFDMDDWETWRKLNVKRYKARKGLEADDIDIISEEFVIGTSFTLARGAHAFDGVDLMTWIDNPEMRKYRFVTWFYDQWKPYIDNVLSPKG